MQQVLSLKIHCLIKVQSPKGAKSSFFKSSRSQEANTVPLMLCSFTKSTYLSKFVWATPKL